MTLTQVEHRVKALERTVRWLSQSRLSARTTERKWYRTYAGRFAQDPEFDEIVKLGQSYRESLRPAAHSKRS
jgi:hypothetical protein